PAYRNVLVKELILDKQGQKMSKSKKNTVDPFGLIARYGADAVRWYLVANSPVWRPTLFDEEGIGEVQRRFFSTLVNTYAFFTLYANVDAFTGRETRIPVEERPEIDRWIVSELQSLVKRYREWMDAYDVTRAARGVADFTVDQLSNWYVRRNRRRFWKSEKGRDKTAAYQTLAECLLTLTKLMAPFAPFLADEIFRNLNDVLQAETVESVHLSDFPTASESAIDRGLEKRMERAIAIVGLVRAMRMKSNLKVRQPLSKIMIPVTGEGERSDIQAMKDVILEEINVKEMEIVGGDSSIVKKKAKPNFKTLGPKFGKSVQPVAARIRELSGPEISELLARGSATFPLNGNQITISPEDMEIQHEEVQGWLVESDGSLTVALDTALTEELLEEGLAREFVNRIQNLRKDSGFEVSDRIRIYHRSTDRLARSLERLSQYIRQETLAQDVRQLRTDEHSAFSFHPEDINGEKTEVALEKIT
ncbi:MAG: DUF5915 domain-containing protein, partial [Bacteroidota bacterium]